MRWNDSLPRTAVTLVIVAFLFLLLVAVPGCQSMQKSSAMDNERVLAAAGFQMKLAQTPDQMSRAEALPQRKLTPTPGPDGRTHFVYADAEFCKCIYVGGPLAYERYQRLEVKQRIAENEEMASMNWGAWGAWGPWW